MTATPYNYSRLSRPVVALDEPAPLDPKEEAFAELEVADYLVFLLAFDTYMRWLKETGQRADHNFGRGLMLLKMAERDHLDKVNSVIAAGVKNPGQLKMLAAGMRLPPSAQGASMRALKLRTVISRGGTATAKHIFGTSIRARKEVTDAIEAATTDDAASALTKFSGIVLKNKRLEKWISTAAETAGKPIVLVNPTHEATKQVAEDGTVLRDQKIAQDAARPDSEDHAEAQVNQANTLARVENQATEAAAKALVTVKAPDEPVTRSQATGIATAVATAVANDPADLKNVPPAFINDGFPLDPEQMDAALTNGRVLVAAGAGSGKSTTLVSRVANLVDQGTSPSKIMAVTFNKKAANELQEKLQKKLGPNRAKSVMCDTMHTVFKKFITGDRAAGIPAFGTPQEQRMMGENLIAPPRKGHPPPRVKPGDISRTIHTMMATCKPKELAEYTGWPEDVFKGGPPKTKKAGLYINKWSGNDVSLDQAKAGARSNKERQAAIYYEFYLGLKGDIPGWRPPCGHDSFNKFMDKYRRGGERLGDMDDMLKIFRDVLRRDPNARAAIQKMFDHILIDEAQDSNTVQHQIYDSLSEQIECDDKKKSIWLVGDDRQAIYQFRGAKPELFQKHWNDGCWKPKTIRTNYRCPPEVVELANKLIAHNTERLPVDALPAKHKTRGEASIRLETMPDNTLAAIDTVGEIRKDIDTDPKKCRPEDYAVLARTNAELNNFETACIINEVPYMRRGGHGFLDAPESKVVLGYLDLASGTDFVKKQKSLMAAITKPDRGLYLTVGQIETAVNEAVDDVARYERKDIKDVDPDIILTNRDYARKFAEYLKGPYKNQLMAKGAWLWNKIVDGLTRQLLDMGRDIHDIRKMTEDPNAKTAQLLGHVLDNVRATTTAWDPSIRREVSTTKTLREDISNSLKLYSSDDDDDDETTEEDEHKPELDAEGRPVVKEKQDEPENPAKGLGAVQFLYALSEPNKNDHELGILPDTAAGFTKKIERFTKLADSLRVDPKKWEDAQAKITDPALRQSKPPAVTLTTVHCSPPDEAILTTEGWIPIGKLDSSKHRLASYLKKCNQLLWNERYEGYPFITETRPYKGTLLTLETASSRTRVTPNHRVLARFSPEFLNKYVVYLMRRGDWWRVGICVSARRPYRSAGVASRMSTEKADAGWILGVFSTRREALMEEARIQAEWGIPGLTFESAQDRSLSVDDLHTIHSRTVAAVGARVSGLLEANGLSADHPLYTRDGSGTFKNNFGHTFTTRACNVVSGYMEMLTVPAAFASQIGPKEDWTKPIYQRVAVSRELYEGNVYSLTVVPHHTYISGGAVVGNSVKGLEWPHATVLMPSGVFPIELKAKPGEPPPTPEEEHEHDISERNLAYVALTRAAKTLKVISIPNPKTKAVSPYIDQAGLTEGENVPKPEAPMAEVVTASDDAFTLVEAAESLDTEALYEIAAWPTESVTSYDRRPQ